VITLITTHITMPSEIMCSSSSSSSLHSQEVVRDPLKSKFLMRLGVVHQCNPITSKHSSLSGASSESSLLHWKLPTRDLQSVPRYTSPLKYNHHEEKKRLERRKLLRAAGSANPKSPSPTTLSKMSKPKRCITFDESVKVVPIPMRSEYSDRIRSRLWSNTIELYENAGKCRCYKFTYIHFFFTSYLIVTYLLVCYMQSN
jgi:hypothetical protein